MCRSVCVSICVQQWEWWPTCYRCHSDHGVLCKRRLCMCVCECVSLHAVSHHWGWCGGQFIFAAVACLWLSFRLSKILPQTWRNSRHWASYFGNTWSRFVRTCSPKILAAYFSVMACAGLDTTFKSGQWLDHSPVHQSDRDIWIKEQISAQQTNRNSGNSSWTEAWKDFYVCVRVIECMDIFKHIYFWGIFFSSWWTGFASYIFQLSQHALLFPGYHLINCNWFSVCVFVCFISTFSIVVLSLINGFI